MTAVTVTGHAQLTAWQQRVLPPVEEVRSGLWSIPVPFPGNPLRYTLCYVLVGDSSVAVVDPGWSSDEGWIALQAGLSQAGCAVRDVSDVLLSHVHFDHHGLTTRLVQASGASVSMHRYERDSLPARLRAEDPERQSDVSWLRACGVPDEVIADFRPNEGLMSVVAAMVEPNRLLEDGRGVWAGGRILVPVWTPGHTPGHLCFYDQGHQVLLTGDHLLPRITPAIGLSPQRMGEPLEDYLASLDATQSYDAAEALPGHEYRFRGIRDRAMAIRLHHEERNGEILTALAEVGPATAWEITARLSWSRGWANVTGFMRRAALSETTAHIRYLLTHGELRQQSGEGDSPIRYELVPDRHERLSRPAGESGHSSANIA